MLGRSPIGRAALGQNEHALNENEGILGNHYLAFDGVDDYIRMPNFTMPSTGIFSYSIDLQAYLSASAGVFLQFGSFSRLLMSIYTDTGRVLFDLLKFGGAREFISIDVDFTEKLVINIEIDFDLNELRFYINNALIRTNTTFDFLAAYGGQTSSQHNFGNEFNARFLQCDLYKINVNNELLYKNYESNELTYLPEILQGAHATMFNFTLPNAWDSYTSPHVTDFQIAPSEVKTNFTALSLEHTAPYFIKSGSQTKIEVPVLTLQNMMLVDFPTLEILSPVSSLNISETVTLKTPAVEVLSKTFVGNLEGVDRLIASLVEQMTETQPATAGAQLHFFVVNAQQLTETQGVTAISSQQLGAVNTEQQTDCTVLDLLDQANVVVVGLEQLTDIESLGFNQQTTPQISETETKSEVEVTELNQKLNFTTLSSEQLTELTGRDLPSSSELSTLLTETNTQVNSVYLSSLLNFKGAMSEQLSTVDIISIVSRNLNIDPENIIPLGSNVIFALIETTEQFRLTMR